MKKLFIACVGAAMLTPPVVWAQDASPISLQDQMAACSAIAESDERLKCFDAISTNTPAAPQAAPATPQPVPSTQAAPAEKQEQKRRLFGLRGPKPVKTEEEFGLQAKAEEKEITQISAEIVETKFRRNTAHRQNAYRIVLDNGQVWSQLKSDSRTLRIRDDRTYTANVTRGAMGSFWMKVEPTGGRIRVRRIK